MSKTKEELKALKEEVEAVNEKLSKLTGEELEKVCGGAMPSNKWIFLPAAGYESKSTLGE